jgi:hypothetical protein
MQTDKPTLTDEQIDAAIESLFPKRDDQWHEQWMQDVARPIARAILAAASSLPPPGGEPKRTDKDYAIEHAGYLANAARNMLAAINIEAVLRERDDEIGSAHTAERLTTAMSRTSEAMGTLRNRIYEFEKRRDRAASPTPASGVTGAGDARQPPLPRDLDLTVPRASGVSSGGGRDTATGVAPSDGGQRCTGCDGQGRCIGKERCDV